MNVLKKGIVAEKLSTRTARLDELPGEMARAVMRGELRVGQVWRARCGADGWSYGRSIGEAFEKAFAVAGEAAPS